VAGKFRVDRRVYHRGLEPAHPRPALWQQEDDRKVPIFDVDITFPKLPNNWVHRRLKVVVDRHDNVWFIHRPNMPLLKVPEAKRPLLRADSTPANSFRPGADRRRI
jgi:hypothetical protein